MPRSNAVFVQSADGNLTMKTLRHDGEYMVLVGNVVDLPSQPRSLAGRLIATAFAPARFGFNVLGTPLWIAQSIQAERRRAQIRIVT